MTCTTFTLLETTHIQNVQSKSGVYDLYTALERLTDNTGLNDPRVRGSRFFSRFHAFIHAFNHVFIHAFL